MSKNKQGFWISYSDLVTGLMVVFLLIMVTMVLLIKQQSIEQKQNVKEIVEDTKSSIVTRADLAKELKKAVDNINTALGGQYAIIVDDVTAELTLPEEFIRFESNSSVLNQKSIDNLNIFLPEYLCALYRFGHTNGKQYNDISNIFINGFADTEGDPIWNAPLSTNRAREVVNFTMQMLRCQIPNVAGYSSYTVQNLQDQKMGVYLCSIFETTQSNDVLECMPKYQEILTDMELKLKGVGYGDSVHCEELMKTNQSNSCRDFNIANALERKVTFSVDIIGDDMTDLVSYLVELGEIVGLDEIALRELKEINGSIRRECLVNPDKYDGCISNLIAYAKAHCVVTKIDDETVCSSILSHMMRSESFKHRFCTTWVEGNTLCTME